MGLIVGAEAPFSGIFLNGQNVTTGGWHYFPAKISIKEAFKYNSVSEQMDSVKLNVCIKSTLIKQRRL